MMMMMMMMMMMNVAYSELWMSVEQKYSERTCPRAA
jgi:hypothetical protein